MSLENPGKKSPLTLCNQSVEMKAFGAVALTVAEGRHLMTTMNQCGQYL